MKKTLFAAAALLALVAQADYIYWMVSDNPANGYDWDTAYLVQGDTRIGTLTASEAASFKALDAYAYSTLNSGYETASFFIELYNGGSFAAQSETKAYADVKSYIFGGNPMSPAAAGGGGFMPAGSTYNVPEPTSGLLFLIGGVLLGLKRRRMV